MQTLQISKESALKTHSAGSPDTKKTLENLLGAEHFRPQNIMDRVKTWEDACHVVGLAQHQEEDRLSKHNKSELAYAKLCTIAKALNEGWEPDWTKPSQYKYYPWFELSSGSGLSYDDFDYLSSYSVVGSRLCFKSRELTEYAAKQFISIYQEFFII
ncbi:MAG: hypothetical protein ACT4OJ_14140 [Bacteroidota bacterium]